MRFRMFWKTCLALKALVFLFAGAVSAAQAGERDAEPRSERFVAAPTKAAHEPIAGPDGRYADYLDVPGKLIGSQRIIPINSSNFPNPEEWGRVERGADYLHHFALGEELRLKGVPVGRSGQVLKRRVKITTDDNEDINVWVVLETVSAPGTVVTAVIYIGDDIDRQKLPVENIRKNRWIAENAFAQAIREWERAQAKIHISYAHYIFDERHTVEPEEDIKDKG